MIGLLPKDIRFFELFEKTSATIVEGARCLETVLADVRDVDAHLARLRELEHSGDVTTFEAIDRLNKTFLTPFDREDLHALTLNLDDILDLIEEAGQRIGMFRIERPRDDASRLANTLVRTCAEVQAAVAKLRDHPRSADALHKHLAEINRLEHEGDALFREALSRLFEVESANPVQILKWKEIYEAMENAIDGCEQVAHIIGSILVKHA